MFVYVMSAGEKRHKIGVALNPDRRRHDLQCGSADRLEVVFSLEVHGHAREIEAATHGLLREHRAHGEWFEVTAAIAIDGVQRAVSGERAPRRKPEGSTWWIEHPPISIRLPPPVMSRVLDWASANGLNRHAALIHLLRAGLDAEGVGDAAKEAA